MGEVHLIKYNSVDYQIRQITECHNELISNIPEPILLSRTEV